MVMGTEGGPQICFTLGYKVVGQWRKRRNVQPSNDTLVVYHRQYDTHDRVQNSGLTAIPKLTSNRRTFNSRKAMKRSMHKVIERTKDMRSFAKLINATTT